MIIKNAISNLLPVLLEKYSVVRSGNEIFQWNETSHQFFKGIHQKSVF